VAVIAPTAPLAAVERDAAIRAVGLRHTYRAREGAVEALAPTDLVVGSGELLAVLGPSGCGKSTLLRILAGLIEPSAGLVRLAGRPPTEVRRHQGIGWLAQDDGLLPWRSVADNVALPLRIGRRGSIDTARIAAVLELVGLSEAARRYPHELSGGMRQRAALARALVARPAFLFLDEPFASLDELTRERLGELLLAVRAAGRPTTLLVTHSVAEAVRLADRVVVLSPRPGRILANVPVALDHPRRDDQPGFGGVVQGLKEVLRRR
jgi:NitT/TauT family transport system ATP-binding protein